MDAADLPVGASYDREIGFMNLEPGEYEAVIQCETSLSTTIATIRRISE